ncbi:MAG TPA: BatD family protein, partial [Candidatus Saccharimonadales bacterium]|nr:BatD family protein [Candidatus Saccharimonadales bacterium]
ILPLPIAGRPAGFSGAVGQFEVNSELSDTHSIAGDPLTLRMKVTGSGSFDRVNTTMLGLVDGWKTYQPTAKFQPADSAGYSGERDFEQAVIPTQAGRQTLPALAFSFFNPVTKEYETKRTAALSVDVSAAAGGLTSTAPAPSPSSTSASEPPRNGLRADHVQAGGEVASLRPLYFRPWFLGSQSALVLCFAGGFSFLRRHDRRAKDIAGARRRETSGVIAGCQAEMDAASAAGDAPRFFQSARGALQQKLATQWQVAPASITIAEIDTRLNGEGGEIRRVFALADQAAYSGQNLTVEDFEQWKETVRNELKHTEVL